MAIPAIVTMVGGALLRNVQGFLPTFLEDGRIDRYEWRKLIVTSSRVVFVAACLHWGFEADELTASSIAVLVDFGISEIGKMIDRRKKK